MNVKEVLGAFLLVNNPIVLSEEETKDVQKAIKQLQQENKRLKDNWNKLKEYLENKIDEYSINLEYLSVERMTQIKNKMQELNKEVIK